MLYCDTLITSLKVTIAEVVVMFDTLVMLGVVGRTTEKININRVKLPKL